MANNVNVLDRMPAAVIRAIQFTLAAWENPVGLERPLWWDISRYQGMVDHMVAHQNGVLGMIARATISWGYVDPFFQSNWDAAGEIPGYYRSGYHVIYADQDVIRQLDNHYRVMPEIDVIPRVIDLELDRAAPWVIAGKTWEMVEEIKKRDGIHPIIYSRKDLIEKWLVPYWDQSQLNAVWWHLAQYLYDRVREHPGPPTLPDGVEESRVVLHQTADKKAPFPGSCQSYAVDWDRWEIGNISEMHLWISENWGGDLPPDPDPGQGLYFQVLQDGLNIRTGPGTSFSRLGSLNAGDVVQALDVGGNDSWVAIRYGHQLAWCNVQYGQDVNLQLVDPGPAD